MTETQVIPPVPQNRQGQYLWIDKMVALGFSVTKACELAGVPKVSYYKLHLNKQSDPANADATGSGANDHHRDEINGSDTAREYPVATTAEKQL